MEYNRLRLNDDELAFVLKRYPQVDYNNLMYLAEGMTTIRNIDLLISSLDYDLQHITSLSDELSGQDPEAFCREIRDKAVYFRDHNCRHYVRGFNPELYCKKADEIAMAALGEEIGNDIYKIDQSINYVRSISDRVDSDKKLWNIAVYLGTKLGELMLDNGLSDKDYDWDIVEPKKYPEIIDTRLNMKIDPIRFVYDKLKGNSAFEGNCSDLYYRFLDRIESE